MPCSDIGSYGGAAGERVDYAITVDPSGACQSVRVGEHSPGPVANDEYLARFVFAPTHLSKSPPLDTAPIDESVVEELFSHGVSVTRVHQLVDAALIELHEKGEAMAAARRDGSDGRNPDPGRRYVGLLCPLAGVIRRASIDAVPHRVRVYDTSKGATFTHHAEIMGNKSGLDKEKRKALRVAVYMIAMQAGLLTPSTKEI